MGFKNIVIIWSIKTIIVKQELISYNKGANLGLIIPYCIIYTMIPVDHTI